MPAANADRNLLFGILALQMDFISREALLTAMNAWVLDKAKSLGQVLREHGALRDDLHALVETLVQKHLEVHGNDTAQSLVSVPAFGSVRNELEQVADPEVRANLEQVPPTQSVDSGANATQTFTAGAPTSGGLRFRILRRHARGGLGEVFVAEDVELHREVALKELQDRYADEEHYRARFLVEAEITGGLEHPGIVPVYGLGQYPDGRPYYAMRFIRGDSLQNAIQRFHQAEQPGRDPDERTLSLRQLVGRFLDACDALAYAHARGVLHRDVKPGNIMLGKFGETLVVDWGLAKAVGREVQGPAEVEGTLRPVSASGSAATQLGSAVGTPQYMPPEQAMGRHDQLGPASDVYSLGATLYHVLTGQPPVAKGDVGDVLQRVQRGDFPPPRQVKRSVPPALEAICLKAMALKPQDRYATVQALAGDIEHWLADEPVSTYREPLRVRLGRWLRRHQTLAAGVAVVVVTALVALGVGFLLVQEEQARTEDQRQAAVQARNAADENAVRAEKARARAETESVRADRQSQLALQTLQAVVKEIQIELKNVPGAHAIRQRMLQSAIDGLKKVENTLATSQQKDHNLILAYWQIGDLLLDSGGIDQKNWTQEAQGYYRTAHDLARQWATAAPGSAQAQRDLSVAHSKLARVSQRRGQMQGALQALQTCLTIREQLAADPAHVQAQRDLSIALADFADLNEQLGDPKAAQEAAERCLAIRQRLAAAQPGNSQAQRDLSIAYDQLGDVRRRRKDLKAARELFEESLAIRQQLATAGSATSYAQRDLANAYDRLGIVSQSLRAAPIALKHYQLCLALRQQLAMADPANVQAQRDLSIAYDRMGGHQLQFGKAQEAHGYYQKRLAICRQLAAADPESAQAQRDLSIACQGWADVNQHLRNKQVAQGAYQESLAISQRLASAAPEDFRAKSDLAHSYWKLGAYFRQELQFPEALACYGGGLLILHPLQKAGMLRTQSREAQLLKKLEQTHASCQTESRAVDDLDFALSQQAGQAPRLLGFRVRVLCRRGQHVEAAVTAQKRFDLKPERFERAYEAACDYALCLAAVGAGKAAAELNDEEKAVGERYAAQAVNLLRQAAAEGYRNLGQIRGNPDLEALRARADFQAVVRHLEQTIKAEGGK